MKILRIKYEGFGFAEALMAIMITGIAATVLMTISANSMRHLMRTEDMDNMAQLARSAAVSMQGIADNDLEKEAEDKILGAMSSTHKGKCYDFANPSAFSLTSPSFTNSEASIDNNKLDSSLSEDPDFFRILCIEDVSPTTGPVHNVVVKIITGLVKSSGDQTTTKDTKDYEYISIINLVP